MDTENNNQPVKKRSAFLSIFLSIITPGLGHLYNGKLRLAIIIPVALLIISFLVYNIVLGVSFTLLILGALITIIIYVYAIVHSIFIARENSDYKLKSYNKLLIYLLWPLLFYGIDYILPGSDSARSFRIPTDGMALTLYADDMFIADMNYYKSNEVKRNDVVLLTDPKYKTLIVKRAIAFGGDTISITKGQIFINGQAYKEDNPYIIYETRNNFYDFDKTVIPDKYIFFIGDNRPNSLDSRMFGPVPENSVRGKPLYIYYSESFSRIGTTIN